MKQVKQNNNNLTSNLFNQLLIKKIVWAARLFTTPERNNYRKESKLRRYCRIRNAYT